MWTKSLLLYCKIRFTVYKKLILICIIFNLGRINSRVKKTILKLKFLVLFLNEMTGSCRKRIEVANSESRERIEFFSVHLWGGRQQNNFSFWNGRYPFQLYLWMPFLSDFFSFLLLVRWIIFQFAKWLCWLCKLFVLPPKARGKKNSPMLISVGSTYSHFSSHKCFVRATLLLATPGKQKNKPKVLIFGLPFSTSKNSGWLPLEVH